MYSLTFTEHCAHPADRAKYGRASKPDSFLQTKTTINQKAASMTEEYLKNFPSGVKILEGGKEKRPSKRKSKWQNTADTIDNALSFCASAKLERDE